MATPKMQKMQRSAEWSREKAIDDVRGSFAGDAAQTVDMGRAMRPRSKNWSLLKGGSKDKQEREKKKKGLELTRLGRHDDKSRYV